MHQMKKVSPWIGFALLINLSCQHEPFSSRVSDYPVQVAQIVETSCAVSGCHVGESAPENLDLSSWDKAFEGSDFGAVIIPGAPDWSHLFQHLNTYEELGAMAEPQMPPNGNFLSREEVITIREWISEGAKSAEEKGRWDRKETQTGGKLFNLCAGSDLIAVTDLETNLLMRFIEVGEIPDLEESPHYIALSPQKDFLYLTLLQGNRVEKYRTDTYEKVGSVEVGESPALIEVDPSGKYLIISHWNATSNSPKLSLLDAQSLQVVHQLIGSRELLSFGHGMAATSDFSLLYIVANEGNYYAKYEISAQGFIEVDKILIDPDNSPFAQATTAYRPYHCLLSPDESTFFVSCSETNEVRVFDTATDTLRTQIPTGDFPRLMTYDEVDQRIFIACAKEENVAEQGSMRGCVSVIDANSLSFVQNIYRLGHRPHGIGVSPGKRQLFVSSENNGRGSEDPPHHFVQGIGGTPGKYNIVDLNSLQILREEETEIAVFPNALVVVE